MSRQRASKPFCALNHERLRNQIYSENGADNLSVLGRCLRPGSLTSGAARAILIESGYAVLAR